MRKIWNCFYCFQYFNSIFSAWFCKKQIIIYNCDSHNGPQKIYNNIVYYIIFANYFKQRNICWCNYGATEKYCMGNAEDMESFLLFSVIYFHIFRIFFRLISIDNEWGSRGRRFDSCHSDHRNKGHLVRGVPFSL